MNGQFLPHIVCHLLNKLMQKNELQHQIRKNETADTTVANDWLASNGLNAKTIATTHIRLLQAQKQAHALLTHHRNLLTEHQREILEGFQQKMGNKRTRDRLKPSSANPVLNISTKINRQLFKKHRQLTQA